VKGAMVNVAGTLHVFEAARKLPQIPHIVYASSAAVAGSAQDYKGKIKDSDHHIPRTHYGVFKLANEGNARIYWYSNYSSNITAPKAGSWYIQYWTSPSYCIWSWQGDWCD
jgi:nucleoside-diphosphate-sugar epimerase